MSVVYSNFSEKIYREFEGQLTSKEIDDLLGIREIFDRDTPVSTGKRLIIDRVNVVGEKDSGNIDFSINYKEGINMLVADNLKGKSTTFKVIKFALTAKNSLQADVKSWLKYALVNFRINQKQYTVFLDLTKRSLSAKLFLGNISSLTNIDLHIHDEKTLFHATSIESFKDQIQDFFFTQFSYYSLKWTQKSSSKQKTGLDEVGTSWATYFQSILLESKDSYALMFGGQDKKLFEMLLGLELTLPINRLIVKKDKIEYEKARNSERLGENEKIPKEKSIELRRKIQEVHSELLAFENNNSERLKATELTAKFNQILKTIEINNNTLLMINNEIKVLSKEISNIDKKILDLKEEENNILKEINLSIKQKNNLEEFIQIGAFFSNLEIKHCPACDNSISKLHRDRSIQQRQCSLCHESVIDKSIDVDSYEKKIKYLNELLAQMNLRLDEIKIELLSLSSELTAKNNELSNTVNKKNEQPESSNMDRELSILQQEITVITNKKSQNMEREKLIAHKAVLEFQLDQLDSQRDITFENYDLKLQVLNLAFQELLALRAKIGTKVTKRLSSLMTQEVQTLGLNSISEVIINQGLDIKYKKNNSFVTFNDISEGEQLRAKLAYYLSLIQMDIEFNLGRHTRLLMIDSPAKEEGDDKYLEGFSQLLTSIEKRFGSELQILVATAERDLEDVVTNQKVIPKGQFVF